VPDFTLDCYQNEYLPEQGRDVDAVVTITATGSVAAGPDGAEVIVVDTSGSMDGPKIRQAAQATAAAIDAIRDGVRFAVVSGNHNAQVLYPHTLALAVASPATRGEAKAAAANLRASGGTAIGAWISLATRLLAPEPGLRHVILLTDGKDEHESPEDLDRALAAASGVLQCDCRGVGTDWVVAELRKVSTALLGSVDIVADPAGLADDFTAMMQMAMGRQHAQVDLRVWTPQGATVAFVKQVAPDVADLTGTRVTVGPRQGDYPTGAWGTESRDYHLSVTVNPGAVGDEMLAARVTLLVDGLPSGQALVKATWTDDTALSTKINRQVAHYTGQAELAEAIQEGLEARKTGDIDTATARLGRAVQLAAASGNQDTADLLAKVVDVDDAGTGRVRLKRDVDNADEMTLDTRSTRTVRVGR
jgi:von Willebrand factor type A C-terminal domain/von Willebrand factor type A domain